MGRCERTIPSGEIRMHLMRDHVVTCCERCLLRVIVVHEHVAMGVGGNATRRSMWGKNASLQECSCSRATAAKDEGGREAVGPERRMLRGV